jgi:alkanesulfonate monooxygenase SsuD/methylene tetrahydromethanopterin reductase-like flavin-dependent oxidoreductase (luciferase family)
VADLVAFPAPNACASQWSNYAKGCAEGGHRADRANWRVARSIFVADDDKTAKAYGGDDAKSPYRFYMSQLTPSCANRTAWAASRSGPTWRTRI